MNVEDKIIEIQNFMASQEKQLKSDISNDLEKLNLEREKIQNKYKSFESEAIKDYQHKNEEIQNAILQAQTLIDGIHRKLFKKQRDKVVIKENKNIENLNQILTKLKKQITKFEKTFLPSNLRDFLDSTMLLFHSKFGQTRIKKILNLYNAILQMQNSGELERTLNEKINHLKQSQLKELNAIDDMAESIIEKKTEEYFFNLKNKVFTF